MDFASGEVVDTPRGATAYCAIFRIDDQVLFEWPVKSVGEGQTRIRAALDFLQVKMAEIRNGRECQSLSTLVH
jgi:hypothetical protein